MGTSQAARRAAAALLGAGLLAACTIDERFTFEDPVSEISLIDLNASPASPETDCNPGTTVYWGSARNTGDTFLYDVRAVVDVAGAAGDLLGTFEAGIFHGETASDAFGNPNPETTLDLGQQGSFTVCTNVPFGRAVRADVRFRFVTFEPEG